MQVRHSERCSWCPLGTVFLLQVSILLFCKFLSKVLLLLSAFLNLQIYHSILHSKFLLSVVIFSYVNILFARRQIQIIFIYVVSAPSTGYTPFFSLKPFFLFPCLLFCFLVCISYFAVFAG